MKSAVYVVVIALVAVAAVFGVGYFQKQLSLSRAADTWQTYTSPYFDFQITIPSNWVVVEFPNDEIAPRVNIYSAKQKRSLTTTESGIERVSPITHHFEGPHVSIFPRGVPTEGFFGTFINSDVSFAEETRVAHDFILKDGTHFATFASFIKIPASWNEAGFVWARAGVRRLQADCFRGEKFIKDKNTCDPLFGDTIIHTGVLNEKEREIQKTILASFAFIKTE